MTIQENRLEVAERKMCRWGIYGFTRKDHVRSEETGDMMRAVSMSTRCARCRVRWFCHVKLREQEYVGRKVTELVLYQEIVGQGDQNESGWTVWPTICKMLELWVKTPMAERWRKMLSVTVTPHGSGNSYNSIHVLTGRGGVVVVVIVVV